MAARPAVAHYRLSRKEYQNTVYDLLGVRLGERQEMIYLPFGLIVMSYLRSVGERSNRVS